MFTLHVLQGPDKGRTFRFGDEPASIGRHSEHIQLTDTSASRLHSEVKPEDGRWILHDLNSSNGTYVNGRRIVAPTLLHHGDQIKVGNTLLVFEGKEGVGAATGPDRIQDLIELDMGNPKPSGGSILSSVASSEESVILQSPETADAVAAWNVIYRFAELLGTAVSLEQFLERVADIVLDNLAVDHLVILVKNPETGKLVPQVLRYRYQEGSQRPRIPTSNRIINHVLKSRDGVLCANAMTDERFSGEDSADSIHRLGLRSVICVPIVKHDEVDGIIHMDCSMSYHTYTQEQLRLTVAVGKLTGMAIENAQLVESRMRTERLAAAGEAVSYMSHHIRNIVQGLQGGASVVELGIKKKNVDTIQSGWDIVRRNLERTSRLTMNMLTFGKDRQPKVQTAQINKTVNDVVSLAQRSADEKGIMILTDLEEMPAVPFDPEGIHQALNNIVRNAIEAVQADTGRVNIRTKYDPPNGQVIVTVADNGPGIEKSDLATIFDAFNSSKGQGGTGLGLAAAKKIIAEHNGEIEADSTVGEGTTFHIKLPAVSTRSSGSDDTHGPSRRSTEDTKIE